MEVDESLAELLVLLGKRFNILLRLSKKKYYVSDLAKELHRHASQISMELKELEKRKLLKSEQKAGERRKYYELSEYGKMIVLAISHAAQPIAEGKLENRQLDRLLRILEDKKLSDNLRKSYSASFLRVCREHPREVMDNVEARKLLVEVIEGSFDGAVGESLRGSVSAILLFALRVDEWSEWISRTIYPVLIENLRSENQEIKLWSMKRLGQIAGLSVKPSLRHKIEEKFFEIWFSGETDSESGIGETVVEQIVYLFSNGLFEKVMAKTKNAKDKEKAEILLEKLKEFLMPR
jgi:DNA-binding MarR family transcriptional regulator